MAVYTTIDNPELYFQTKLYTGTGSAASITLDGDTDMQPDLVWIKIRSEINQQRLLDSIRGATNELYPDLTSKEETTAQGLTAFDSDGFSLGTDHGFNKSTATYASWNWKANGSGSLNEVGSIDSTVSANTTAGFSIVSWTGSGASATIGHGLSSSPELIIVKNRTDSATDWRIGNTVVSGKTMSDGNGYYLEFDTGAIANPGSATIWGSPATAPTSSLFSVGSNNSNNGSSDAMIAYCFHSVQGYSKFGSYTGNGNADGTFVYTGFSPAFVIVKRTDAAESWFLYDNKRNAHVGNERYYVLKPNTSGAENTTYSDNWQMDFLSNGFKLRTTAGHLNSGNLIYMCFAESPLVSSTGVPACAR
jgi:hypothetical protein